MQLNEVLLKELNHEAASTKKILERVPEDQMDFKPHEKSMSLGRLAGHVAELTNWVTLALTTDELDFSKAEYKPVVPATSKELMELFQTHLDKAIQALTTATAEDLAKPWKLRNGDHIILDIPRRGVLRALVFNHIIHHRGQLTVYLRLLNVPVPGMYGPSADERF